MRKMSSFWVAVCGMGLLLCSSPAFAALDVTDVTVDTAPVFALAVTILTALGSIWVIRKAIKTVNKS